MGAVFNSARWALTMAVAFSARVNAETGSLPEDLKLLEGKKVFVGRLVLCVPKTYSADLSYAGKPATVVSFQKNDKLDSINNSMNRLPDSVRQMFSDQQKGGMLSLKFEDGKILDTCGNIGHSAIAAGLDLAPGETINAADERTTAPTIAVNPPPSNHPQECPVSITAASSGTSFGHMLADVATTSEVERRVDRASHGGNDKHYLDIKVMNTGAKSIKAFEFAAVYANKMGDSTTSAVYISQNSQLIAPGATLKTSAMDRTQVSQNGAGEVKLYISRVRFADDTSWSDDGTRSCSRVTAFR